MTYPLWDTQKRKNRDVWKRCNHGFKAALRSGLILPDPDEEDHAIFAEGEVGRVFRTAFNDYMLDELVARETIHPVNGPFMSIEYADVLHQGVYVHPALVGSSFHAWLWLRYMMPRYVVCGLPESF